MLSVDVNFSPFVFIANPFKSTWGVNFNEERAISVVMVSESKYDVFVSISFIWLFALIFSVKSCPNP